MSAFPLTADSRILLSGLKSNFLSFFSKDLSHVFFCDKITSIIINLQYQGKMGKEEPLTAEQIAFSRKWIVLISAFESVVKTGIKLIAALYTGSAGMPADSIHSGADVAGSFLVWIGGPPCLLQ